MLDSVLHHKGEFADRMLIFEPVMRLLDLFNQECFCDRKKVVLSGQPVYQKIYWNYYTLFELRVTAGAPRVGTNNGDHPKKRPTTWAFNVGENVSFGPTWRSLHGASTPRAHRGCSHRNGEIGRAHV